MTDNDKWEIPRLCCSSLPRHKFISFNREMAVIMKGREGAYRGFLAKVYSDVDIEVSRILLLFALSYYCLIIMDESLSGSDIMSYFGGFFF